MKRYLIGSLLVALILGAWPQSAAADSLAIGPLEYTAALKAGEAKKGFVEVQNQSSQNVEVHLKVQAFKQINDRGGLQFYNDAAVKAGVKLDLTDIKIPPHAGAHIYFLLDGSKLPSGDVFAAILASTAGKERAITVPSVQVGTLLIVENGTPPSHHAKITTLFAPWLQIGTKLSAKFAVRNTDPPHKLTGFTPSITVTTWPYAHKTVTGPLVFAGRTREVAYTQPGNYFGPLLLKVKTGVSQQTRLIVAITGFWRWLAPLIFIVILGVLGVVWTMIFRRKKRTA